jgi:hypothetical protein
MFIMSFECCTIEMRCLNEMFGIEGELLKYL